MQIILHLFSALSVLAATNVSSAGERPGAADAERSRIKTCVEVQKSDADIQRRCFGTEAAYLQWKACVEKKKAGGIARFRECYVGKKPAVLIPAEEHFRFRYAFVSISAAQADQVERYADLRALIAGKTTCVFTARDLDAIRHDVEVDASGTATYQLEFDVRGASPGCPTKEAHSASLKFINIPLQGWVSGAGLIELKNPIPTVFFQQSTPISYHAFEQPEDCRSGPGESLFAYMKFDSFTNDLAVGTFAFLATRQCSEFDYVVVFDGSFRLKNRK